MSELYTFRTDGVVEKPLDTYTSLIWTERFIELGEFRLVYPFDFKILDDINVNTWLRLDSSDEIMQVEGIDIQEPGPGNAGSITFSGRTLTAFLENRMIRASSYYSNATSMLYSIATPAKWIGDIVKMSCTNVHYPPGETWLDSWQGPAADGSYPWVIPNLTVWSTAAAMPAQEIIMEAGIVLDKIFEYARAYNIGFKLHYPMGTPTPYFQTWTGNDHTIDSSTPYLFSPSLGNITNIRESRSVAKQKNVAHGWPQNGSSGMTNELHYMAYGAGGNQFTAGWNRRELMYVTPDDLALNAGRDLGTIGAVMAQRLQTELNKYPYSIMLDGDIVQTIADLPRMGLKLGDYVTIQATSGTQKDVRVTEIITSRDTQSGEKLFATFAS